MIVYVGIGLGSNLGDRRAELDAGIALLRELAVDGQVRESQRIDTEPVDCPPGAARFLNSVAELQVDTAINSPRGVLDKLRALECSRGRPDHQIWHESRHLDLDILYFGDKVIGERGLSIPHPQIAFRSFVLTPLAELRPDLVLPGQTQTVQELVDALFTKPATD